MGNFILVISLQIVQSFKTHISFQPINSPHSKLLLPILCPLTGKLLYAELILAHKNNLLIAFNKSFFFYKAALKEIQIYKWLKNFHFVFSSPNLFKNYT